MFEGRYKMSLCDNSLVFIDFKLGVWIFENGESAGTDYTAYSIFYRNIYYFPQTIVPV